PSPAFSSEGSLPRRNARPSWVAIRCRPLTSPEGSARRVGLPPASRHDQTAWPSPTATTRVPSPSKARSRISPAPVKAWRGFAGREVRHPDCRPVTPGHRTAVGGELHQRPPRRRLDLPGQGRLLGVQVPHPELACRTTHEQEPPPRRELRVAEPRAGGRGEV